MLTTGLDFCLGRLRGGFFLAGFKFITFSPAKTLFTTSTISAPKAGPTTPLKYVSEHNRSKLIFGKQPAIMIFLFFGACFRASIMRFSVGPLTPQVLKIKRSASCSDWTIWNPAFARQPAKTSPSAMLDEQPKFLMKTCVSMVYSIASCFNKE
jgi:hypothetical protein